MPNMFEQEFASVNEGLSFIWKIKLEDRIKEVPRAIAPD